MQRLILALIIVALQWQVAPAPATAAPGSLDAAVKSYNARQYSTALSQFQEVCRTNPNDELAHYYMALCYQSMNQFSLAKQQYEWVNAVTKNPTLKASCAQALSQLGRYQSQRSTGTTTTSYNPPGSGSPSAPVRISGRLRVIEFYTDW